jgi:GNAT superfamily N-acetyltransferase
MAEIVPMETWWHLEHSLITARMALPDGVVAHHALRNDLLHPDAKYFVALVNGGVKGFAGVKKTGVNTKAIFEFPWCIIHPEYQGHGLGRALTEARINYVREAGGSVILLTTPHPQVYEKYGFRVLMKIPDWADNLMVKEL